MTEGDELIGWGVATATYPMQTAPCAVRVSLDAAGEARVQVASHDLGTGAYMNDNISEYLVPVNADIQQIEAILVPEVDERVNPAGVKGIGEIGIVGTAAVVVNAVHHATGIRVRKTPIRIEDILPSA